MNWTINVWCMLLLTSISGVLVFGIWKVCTWQMERRKKLRLIYPMQGIVEFFFLFPLVYISLELWRYRAGEGTIIGRVFCETIQIEILCRVFIVIWIIGVIFQIGNYAWKLWYMKCMLQKSCVDSEKEIEKLAEEVRKNLKVNQKVRVCRSYMVRAPMVTGIFRKCVILPVREYNKKEIEIILCHEMLHLKQRILIRKNVGVLIRMIHWMNPVVYLLMKELDEWGETACDLAVRYQTNCISDFRMYYHMILENMEEQNGVPAMMTQFNKMKGIEKRVMRIKNYKREKDLKTISSVLVIMLFLFGCTTSVFAAGAGFNRAYDAVFKNTIVENEESYQKLEELVEYEEVWNPIGKNVIEEQKGNVTRTVATINWKISKNTIYQTSGISLKNGNKITVSVGTDPSDKTVKMGIVTPDSKMRYVLVTGNGLHTFDITMDGTYRVFVQNDNSVTVEVAGYYSY